MEESEERDRSRGVWSALGVDRLKNATTVVTRRKSLLAAWQDFEPATQRFVFKAVLLILLALFGFWSFLRLGPSDPTESLGPFILDSIVKTFQLFTFQYTPHSSNVSWVIQLARLVLPTAALFVGALSFSRRFSRRFFAARTARSRTHAVLIGSSEVSVALARAYREKLHRPVIAILPTEPGTAAQPIEKVGADIVIGDPSRCATLRRAGLQRATALIAVEDVGATMIGLGTAVARIGRDRSADQPPLPFVMRLNHQELRDLATAHLSQSLRESRIDLRLYARERTIARGLLARYPADWGLPPAPHDLHAVILGLGEMGSELLLQLARIAVPSPGRRTVLTVIDRDADALKERLLGEYPGLRECAELRFNKAEIRSGAITRQELDDWLMNPLPATSIYVCCGDDHVNLAAALGLRRAYRRAGIDSPPIFVDQRASSAQVCALPHIHGRGIDTLRIISFGDIEDEADPLFLLEEEIDDLARRLHENYLATVSAPGPAVVPWSQLEETYRAANRSLADHLQMKLRALGIHATGSVGVARSSAWTWNDGEKPQIEALAAQEHERWCRDRWLHGWTFDAKRDNNRLLHPDLVPYDKLGEMERKKDRDIILNLPNQLAPLGVGLKRERRIGLWFESDKVAPPEALVGELMSKLDRRSESEPSLHRQLVLPLRATAEWRVAAALARHGSVGLDVAVIRYSGFDDAGTAIDRSIVQKMIAAADRAFVLAPVTTDNSAADSVRLSALCGVCDTVLLACENAEQASGLLSQIGEVQKKQVELVALRF